MVDLQPYAARVTAAVTTGQQLDYAADVSALVHEVLRLQRGVDAVERWYGNLYWHSTQYGRYDHQTLRDFADEAAVVERVVDLMHQEMA